MGLKFKLVIAYDGTAYDGWQVQKTGIGVQQKGAGRFIHLDLRSTPTVWSY